MTEDELQQKAKVFQEAFEQSNIKECFYFDHTNCNNIIRAHSIQKNKILRHIANNGMVVAYKKSIMPFNNIKSVGKKVASTFTGFCKKHDDELFTPIEKYPYQSTPQQKFLYAYRAFAYETHKKLEMQKMIEIFNNKTKEKLQNIGLNNSIKIDYPHINNLFKDCFLKDDYSALISYEIILDYEVQFTVSSVLTPKYDISGKKINRLMDTTKPVQNLYLTIFPENGKTIMLFSWFKESDKIYKKWFYQFKSLPQDIQKNYLNVFIPLETENFYLSPDLWDSWGQDGQSEFQQYLEIIPLIAMPYKPDDYVPKYDLFKKKEKNNG